ncbi:type I DNA topoisomerase [Acinetobacter baumannii]|uniref:type I DNA topoisomerase n=3 Tax=Acinetobacter calcoaceticus/baumannii complex TaxID=909768 RepID=UPI000E67A910|nr:type I DNA topoisomerase [Acinetobacter baumannii]RIX33928.1 type I DNA topoisomerase [Acinetobacter baumannii]RIX39238.1 type I DNA topoisomerase [Acinetobacter baumannii]RJO32807.1 type I DNA topoisomerase [Acinetobacter baumannii]
MKLMIVESPTKAKTIKSYLGDGWIVKATIGHIRDLVDDELGVDIENGFMPKYAIYKDKEKLVAELKKLALTADEIFLASDPDREGEAIAYHITKALKLTNPKRIVFNEISKSALNQSLKNARSIDFKMVNAQETRRILDRLYGYLISPVLSKQSGRPLSAGRVQSAALKILKLRDDEIKNFVKTKYYEIELNVNGVKFSCVNTTLGLKKDEKILDRTILEDIAENITQLKFNYLDEEIKQIKPRACFTTASLQQVASSVLGIQVKKVMDIAQKLFESGYISYHRTDSQNLSTEKYQYVSNYVKNQNIPVRDTQLIFKAKDSDQSAHDPIAVKDLNIKNLPDEFSKNEKALYELIYERTILNVMENGEDSFKKIVVDTDYQINGVTINFELNSTSTKKLGWREFLVIEKSDKDDTGKNPDISISEKNVCVDDFIITDKTTKPSPRYTERDLVKILEKLEIGRPSTYASIIQTLLDREYAQFEGKFITITDLGRKVIDALEDQAFLNLQYTKNMEASLDQIASGTLDRITVLQECYETINSGLGNIKFKN